MCVCCQQWMASISSVQVRRLLLGKVFPMALAQMCLPVADGLSLTTDGMVHYYSIVSWAGLGFRLHISEQILVDLHRCT